MIEPMYLTIAEVCEILTVSDRTVRRMAHDGEIPAVRIGERSLRFPREEFEAWELEYRQTHRVGAAPKVISRHSGG